MKAEIYYTCPAKYIAADGEKDKLLPPPSYYIIPSFNPQVKSYIMLPFQESMDHMEIKNFKWVQIFLERLG